MDPTDDPTVRQILDALLPDDSAALLESIDPVTFVLVDPAVLGKPHFCSVCYSEVFERHQQAHAEWHYRTTVAIKAQGFLIGRLVQIIEAVTDTPDAGPDPRQPGEELPVDTELRDRLLDEVLERHGRGQCNLTAAGHDPHAAELILNALRDVVDNPEGVAAIVFCDLHDRGIRLVPARLVPAP